MGKDQDQGKPRVTEMELLRWSLDNLGAIRSGRLVLFCLYWRATGSKSFTQVAEREEGLRNDRATRYRAYQDLGRLRDWVAEVEGPQVRRADVASRLLSAGAPGSA